MADNPQAYWGWLRTAEHPWWRAVCCAADEAACTAILLERVPTMLANPGAGRAVLPRGVHPEDDRRHRR